MNITFTVILIFLLVFINALLAGSEAALIAVNDLMIKEKAAAGHKKAKKVLRFMENPTGFLSTIQIGITFMGFINAMIAADAFTLPILEALNLTGPNAWGGWYTVTQIVITLILTMIQVIFGELVPKRIAIKKSESFIYLTVGALSVLSQIMRPIVWFLTKAANGVSRIFGVSATDNDETMTEEEIRMIVTAGGKRGVLDKQESDMITNVLDFDDISVSEIMTHRTEMSAIALDIKYDDLIKYVLDEQYTRFPVYKESVDHIVGILHIKDLFKCIANPTEKFSLKKIIRTPLFVPDTQSISELFGEMKAKKTHIAIVIDEYGGTAGMITIEDLLEEIVGNIMDEYDRDEEEEHVVTIKDGEYEIDGLMNIDHVEDVINAGLPVDDYDTLSGFILGQLGRLPSNGESICFEYNGFKFEVISYDDNVISKVRVTKDNLGDIE